MSNLHPIAGVEECNRLIASGLSIVDFWAPWCGPCRMMMPIVEEIAAEMQNIKFFKLNIDEDYNTPIATMFHVVSIPCFIIFKDGKVLATKPGSRSKQDMINWINSNISN